MRKFLFVVLLGIVAAASALVVDADARDKVIAGIARASAPVEARPKIQPQLLFLVRSTLGALADANRTGNYSVFRDLAAPAFQAKHSAADLALIFTDARRRPMDLAPALMLEPEAFEATRPAAEQLQLTGGFASGTERVTFRLLFAGVGGHWRLADIGLGVDAAQR